MAHTRFFGLDVTGLDSFQEIRLQRAFAYYGIPALDQRPQVAQQPAAQLQPQAIQLVRSIVPSAR